MDRIASVLPFFPSKTSSLEKKKHSFPRIRNTGSVNFKTIDVLSPSNRSYFFISPSIYDPVKLQSTKIRYSSRSGVEPATNFHPFDQLPAPTIYRDLPVGTRCLDRVLFATG